MFGSQKDFLDTLHLVRDSYCKGDKNLLKKFPDTYHRCMQILRTFGYVDPKHIMLA